MNDWRPDPKDVNQYPDIIMDLQWRWEFLRRDKDYQADWLKYKGNKVDLSDYYLSEDEQNHITPMRNSLKVYGMYFLFDPSQCDMFVLFQCLYKRTGELIVKGITDNTFRSLWKKGIRIITIDLNEPIGLQLNEVKQVLQIQQSRRGIKPKNRKHKHNYPKYLRLLDAEHFGWSQLDMYNIIIQGTLTSDDARTEAAKQLSRAKTTQRKIIQSR